LVTSKVNTRHSCSLVRHFFRSFVFHPCDLVSFFQVQHFPAVVFCGPSFSSRANSAFPHVAVACSDVRHQMSNYTARCTILQSAVLQCDRPSVCDVGGSGSHRLEILETNSADN